ncbi:ATP-grasp domain-containing protein [Pantoea agglomerans]|uniref:ATP-grasp domain-containing protein n=1 Tax=Enterobacter agglomerans TaxID=549 RepID=UPI0016543B71|nr:ATP-grasp domain-containing protein [Pantoea agglomerans]
MLLICKYWLDAYKALDKTGANYIAIIEEHDIDKVDPNHELIGGMKGKFIVKSVDSIEAMAGVANSIQIANINIDRVISIGELSQYGAGFLAELLKCKGLSYSSVNLTRDKFLMKKTFTHGNLPCAKFHLISDFIEEPEFGYPMVAKPVCGFGSLNTSIIENRNDLDSYVSAFENEKDSHLIANGIILEEYITGEEFAADCVIVDSKIKLLSISKYIMPRIDLILNKGKYDSVEHLTRSHYKNIYDKIELSYTKIIKYFDIDNCACHLEFFINSDGNIILSEVASRPGGAYLNYMALHVYGKTIYETWFEAIVNNDKNTVSELHPQQHVIIVSIIPQKSGKLITLPDLDQFRHLNTLIDILPRKKLGDNTIAHSIIDFTCYFAFRGDDLNKIKKDIAIFSNSFNYEIE